MSSLMWLKCDSMTVCQVDVMLFMVFFCLLVFCTRGWEALLIFSFKANKIEI